METSPAAVGYNLSVWACSACSQACPAKFWGPGMDVHLHGLGQSWELSMLWTHVSLHAHAT
eukprot:1139610-Pelagomonas_calceolata.AAC.1